MTGFAASGAKIKPFRYEVPFSRVERFAEAVKFKAGFSKIKNFFSRFKMNMIPNSQNPEA